MFGPRWSGVKFKLWTGGFTNTPNIDPPWLLKFVSVLAILSMVGSLIYAVASTLGGPDFSVLDNEDAIYVSILHFLLPIVITYTVTTNSPLSRIVILGYVLILYVSTLRGKGFLGGLEIAPSLMLVISTSVLIAIALWLFASPKMRFYYAVIAGRPVPPDLESKTAEYVDDAKINPKLRIMLDWVSDHLETMALVGLILVVLYAYLDTG